MYTYISLYKVYASPITGTTALHQKIYLNWASQLWQREADTILACGPLDAQNIPGCFSAYNMSPGVSFSVSKFGKRLC